MFLHSIRWRWLLWLAFLLVCVLSGFGFTVFQLQRLNLLGQIDQQLERRVAALSRALRAGPPVDPGRGWPRADGPPASPPPDPSLKPLPAPGRGWPEPFRPSSRRDARPWEARWEQRQVRLPPDVAELFDESRTNGFYYAIWSRGGTMLRRSTNCPATIQRPQRQPDTLTRIRTRGMLREAFHFTELGDCVLAGRSMAEDLDGLRRFVWWLLAAGGAVLAIGLGGGWWLTTHAIRPVEQISAAARRIAEGNLAERIAGADADNELGRLVAVLNSTFARLEAAFDQQKQFTADASHELRTPIAVLITEAQAALARPRTAAEYRETIEACLATAQQMRRLTDSLLDLARLDAGAATLNRQPVDLAALAGDCIQQVRPLAARRNIHIESELSSAPCCGDPDRLTQLITNLLTNAIHYNQDGGTVCVSTRPDGAGVRLTVSDTGQEIAPEDLPHIFDRFYRADKSRARAEGRFGLGLAICKAVVQAHGGTIQVSSAPGQGSTFEVWLPGSPGT
jgi:two-component system OmpR family sensor kinase